MPTIEQIEEGYFNYLTSEIFKALKKADKYDCKDFYAIKMGLTTNLFEMLKSKEQFEAIIQILMNNKENIKSLIKKK